MIEVHECDGWKDGDRVRCTGFGFGSSGGWVTVQRENGKLIVVLDGEIKRVDTVVRVTLSDPDEPVAEGICGRVSGSPDDAECMHGECDDCQIARGEDPVNHGDPNVHPEDPQEADYCAAMAPSLFGPTEWERIVGRTQRQGQAGIERCECGSGVHVRGPGHAPYCRLLAP